MAFTAFRDMKPFSQLMFSAFVILVCFLVFMVLSMIIAIPVFGFDSMLDITGFSDFDDPQTIRVLKYFQVVQSFGLFIVPPVILGWMFSGKTMEYLHLNQNFLAASVIIAGLLLIFAAPLINFAGEINSRMYFPEWLSGVEDWMKSSEEKATRLTEAFLKVETTGGLLFNVFMIAFLPAIGEELLFRGVIQRIFTRMTRSNHWGIWISAILFSALHLQFYGFLPRLLLGVLFGYLLVWSGSMWLPIIGHFLNNGLAVITMFLIDKNKLSPDIETIGSSSGSYYLAVLSFLLIGSLLWLFKNQNRGRELSPDRN
jgi:membrane protease YdiL (CAAX protease family)